MPDEKMKITCPNGSVLTEVSKNGGVYLVRYDISTMDFPFGDYTIEPEEGNPFTITNANLNITDIYKRSKEYYFEITQVPESDLQYAQTRSDIEYLAMMTETDL